MTISENFKNWAIKYLYEIRKNQATANELNFENKQNELTRITKQLDSLLIKYTSPENINGEIISTQDYQTHKNRLMHEKMAIESDLNKQSEQIDEWVELSEKTFNFARYAHIWFNNGGLETKRAILACLGSHLVLKGRKLSLNLHKPFQLLFNNIAIAETELTQVRTSENSDNKRQIAVFTAKCPTLRRIQDLNL